MSGPLNLDADQLIALGRFLEALSALTREHEVQVDYYGQAALTVGLDGDRATLEIKWDADESRYVVNDRIGR